MQNALASLLRRAISAQWSQDVKVKFKQAELDNDSLQALFVDVSARAVPPRGLGPANKPRADLVSQNETRQVGGAVAYLAGSTCPFTLVRGEPGQGKSTIGQYLAQVYRSEFVAGRPDAADDRPRISPRLARVPLRIDIRDYASWLDGEEPFALDSIKPKKAPKPRSKGDIERFFQVLLADLAAADSVALAMVHEFLDRFPVALVFDGLDEVAQPELRRRVVDEIERFVGRYRRGPLMTPKVVVTTRPNVSDLAEPTRTLFELMVLDKLDDRLRTQYLRNWCEARGIEKRDRRDLMRTFNVRKAEPHIAQLTDNPMQLTILLYLLQRQGRSVPDRRTQLYDEYMKTSLAREADKTPSVQANRADLEEVTAYLGWHVQGTAEQENSAGRLRTRQLRSKIFEYLDGNEKNTSLVDALFTDVTDRVWVLTSKVQGTFEFDVQPVREFFAAKYLAHYATEDKSQILNELIARPFWFNASRFFAGFATPNEVSGLVDGLADTLTDARHPLPDRISVWTLLADGVFAQRARAQQRAVELLTDDLSVRLLHMAGDGSDSLPAMPADRGAATYCQRLIDNVTADPTAPLAAERVSVAASLGVESPPLGQWWLEHAGPALGGPDEDAWLQIAVAFAAGRLLDSDVADTLALSDSKTVATATAAGVTPGPGSSTETLMITAILDGHCSDVAAPNTGVVADLVNALAPREFMALFNSGGRASFEMPSAHCTVVLAPEKRRDAFRRLAHVDGRLGKVQAAMNTARRFPNSVAPWSLAAGHLRDVYGPRWLAADIAIIGAAISPDRRRDVGPMNPRRRPFGPDVDYGRLVNDVRRHRRDGKWWRDQHDQLTPSDRAVWIYALVAVVDPQVVADCVDVVAEAVAALTTDELRALMASSSRLGLSGISRRLPTDLVATASPPPCPQHCSWLTTPTHCPACGPTWWTPSPPSKRPMQRPSAPRHGRRCVPPGQHCSTPPRPSG